MAAVASKTDTTVEKDTLPLVAFACDVLAALGKYSNAKNISDIVSVSREKVQLLQENLEFDAYLG